MKFSKFSVKQEMPSQQQKFVKKGSEKYLVYWPNYKIEVGWQLFPWSRSVKKNCKILAMYWWIFPYQNWHFTTWKLPGIYKLQSIKPAAVVK